MDILFFTLFCLILITCVIFNISILIALAIGLILFLIYGHIKGFNIKELYEMSIEGVKTIKPILITFILIGMLTASWRSSGTIATIICYASKIINPRIFILLTFWLTSSISTLTGTAFGTAATMGMICVSMGSSMGLPLTYLGGAALSGCYLGDRCSPVSTSALLVSTITNTDIYTNIKNMLKSALVPFILSSTIFLLMGLSLDYGNNTSNIANLFFEEFNINPLCIIPAALIIILALFKLGVKAIMGISIIASVIISLAIQKIEFLNLLKILILGYTARIDELEGVINGGGIISMVKVSVIIVIASCYSGIFKRTGLLDFLTRLIDFCENKIGHFGTILLVSIMSTCVSCNQTLSIMLTCQLTDHIEKNKENLANYIEDSAVIISPLIPWCIAGNVALTTVGAPMNSIIFSCYLYILPIYSLIVNLIRRRRKKLSKI